MGPVRYALGKWHVKFKRDEMGAAALFCAGNDNAVLNGSGRTEALGKLEFIGDLVVDVDTVSVIVENRSGKNMPYVVLAMNNGSHLCSCRTLQILGLCCRHFWMAICLSCKFRFHIGILNQHRLVEQGRRPMTDWPATVALKWAIARNHAATVEDDAIREALIVPTRGQAGRWQAITDTTTIESSLVDLKEKGATPQDRRFLYVDCIKRTTAALGVGVETIELDHHLNHLVTSFVAQVERTASVGSEAEIAVGNPDVVRLPASSRRQGRKSRAFLGSGAKGARTDGGWVINALFFSRITFSFFEATAVHCASDADTMVAYICGVLCWQWNGREVGGGLLCANNKPFTLRYSPLRKPAHPTDRPTGTIKQLFFWGVFFFFFACALRLSSHSNRAAVIEPQQPAE